LQGRGDSTGAPARGGRGGARGAARGDGTPCTVALSHTRVSARGRRVHPPRRREGGLRWVQFNRAAERIAPPKNAVQGGVSRVFEKGREARVWVSRVFEKGREARVWV
jgi:hypothetical protein